MEMSWLMLLPRAVSGSMTLQQQWSAPMFVAMSSPKAMGTSLVLATTWCHTDTQQVHGAGPCCSQTAALRSASSIPHLGSYAEPGPRTGKLPLPVSSYNTRESLVLHLTWVAQYSWPWGLRCGYGDPEDRESGRSGTDPHLSIVGELAPKEGEQVSRPLISWALAFGRASQAPR